MQWNEHGDLGNRYGDQCYLSHIAKTIRGEESYMVSLECMNLTKLLDAIRQS